jgi:hypothetical protein
MTENTKKRLKGKPFVNSWTKVVECWAPSVGLDAEEAVRVEKVLNPLGAEWGDLGNMKTRIYTFMTGESYGIYESKKREQYRKKQKRQSAKFQRETVEA